MSSPSFAECWTQIRNTIALLEEARKFGHVNSSGSLSNWNSREDTLLQSLEGDSPEIAAAIDGVARLRGNLNGVIANGRIALDPLILQLGKTISAPERDIGSILDRVFLYMNTNNEKITSRSFTRGSVAASGSPVGTGSILRITTDGYGYANEASRPDVVTAECIADQGMGRDRGREIFEIRGRAFGPDQVTREVSGNGSGLAIQSAAKSADDSLVDNASFANIDTAGNTIDGWTSSVTINATNYAADTANYYRAAANEGTTPQALNVKATSILTQSLVTRRRFFDRTPRPWCLQAAWNSAIGTEVGTLALHLGSQSTTVAVGATSGWNILRLPLGTNSWYRNFKQDSMNVKLGLTHTSGTGLLVDDVCLVAFDPFDGSWVLPMGGATAFALEDTYTWTDTATEAILQRWFWRLYNRYLPHTTGSGVTIAEPSV